VRKNDKQIQSLHIYISNDFFNIMYRVAKYNQYIYYEYQCYNEYELCEVTCAVCKTDSKIAFILARFSGKGKEHGIGFSGGGGYTFFSGRYNFRTYYVNFNTPLPNSQYNYYEINSEPLEPEVTYKANINVPLEIIYSFYKEKGRPSYRWDAFNSFCENMRAPRTPSIGVPRVPDGEDKPLVEEEQKIEK
jgi:hypothetical protein